MHPWESGVPSLYVPRLADLYLSQVLADLPAVLVTGPRAIGKTTTALRLARSVVRLDRPAEAAVAAADPDALLRDRETPVLIDEWQAEPAILGALKRAIDADPSPGRFLVTGSARYDHAPESWPGTGRLVRVEMSGLTTRERLGAARGSTFLGQVLRLGADGLEQPGVVPDLRGYVEEILVGGFPASALDLTPPARRAWLDSYLEQVVSRDAGALDHGRDPARIRRFLRALAAHTACVVEEATLFDAAGVDRKTAQAYERLLTALGVVTTVPAWWTGRIDRLVQRPKRFLCDAALAAAALGADVDGILRDGEVLGRLLETYVAVQLRAETAVSPAGIRLHHLRTGQGRQEVDLVAEAPDLSIVAIEVKATSAPKREHGRHLVWLRERLGDRFRGGVVMHTGPRVFRLDEGIAAVPISALWESRDPGA